MEEFYLKTVNYTLILVSLLIMTSTFIYRCLCKSKTTVYMFGAFICVFIMGFFFEALQTLVAFVYVLLLVRFIVLRRLVMINLNYLFRMQFALFALVVGLIFLNNIFNSILLLSLNMSLTIILLALRFVNHQHNLQLNEIALLECDVYKTSFSKEESVESESLKETLESIHKWFRESECYLDSNYSINQLEKDLKIHRRHISSAINKLEEGNFYRFIAFYRIEYAKRIIINNDKYTLESLSLDCGFSSKSSFNKYFKIFEGQTPSSYKLSCT